MTRRFRLSCGDAEQTVTAESVPDLTRTVEMHVYLPDTAEMLAEQAWAGKTAAHGVITLEPEVRA